MFVIQEHTSSAWVGTISAVHNPMATATISLAADRLGYLVVAPEASAARTWRCADHHGSEAPAARRLSAHLPRSAKLAASCDLFLSACRVPTFHPRARVGSALGIRFRCLRAQSKQ